MTEYRPIYENSYALVIGIDHYEHFNNLSTAVYGAQEVGKTLKALGFHLDTLFEGEATRGAILGWLEKMGEITKFNDRVFFYFAGHGATRTASRTGEQVGYLQLADSCRYSDALAMNTVLDEARHIQAKHVFYALDCCFSGLAIPRLTLTPSGTRKIYRDLMRYPAIEVLTAGRADEPADDRLPYTKHSPFTFYFLRGLRDQKAAESDGIIYSERLANYVRESVQAEPKLKQAPQFYYRPGPDGKGGSFVFVSPYDEKALLEAHLGQVRQLIDALPDPEAHVALTQMLVSEPKEVVRETIVKALYSPAPSQQPASLTRSDVPQREQDTRIETIPIPPLQREHLLFEPEWVEIPAGPFLMGSVEEYIEQIIKESGEDWYRRELPQHEVTLPAYRIGKYPVTWAQFEPFVEAGGYTNREYWTEAGWQWREKEDISKPSYWRDSAWHIADHPVNGISWHEAVAYCNWLSGQLGYTVRLPTEAEWEKAARSTDGRNYPWGNEPADETRCNFDNNVKHTTPVGSYSPNGDSPYGCADMSGNVWEWCLTRWRSDYNSDADNSMEGGGRRVLRGGAFDGHLRNVRTSCRNRYVPNGIKSDFGFRTVALVSAGHLAGHVKEEVEVAQPQLKADTLSREYAARVEIVQPTLSSSSEEQITLPPFDDRDWLNLMKRIERGRCTPVVGGEALMQGQASLKDIAQRLAKEYNYPLPVNDLAEVTQYIAMMERSFVKEEIADLVAKAPPFDPGEPYNIHNVLAKLPFSIYITINCDDAMFAALHALGKNPRREICRWKAGPEIVSSIFDTTTDFEPDPSNPVVYHLYGYYQNPDSLVLTEDDFIDYLVNVAANDYAVLPVPIRRALSEPSLLLLGHQLETFAFQTLNQLIIDSTRSGHSLNLISLMPPQESSRISYLTSYFGSLVDWRSRIYWGSLQELAKELDERWRDYSV